jgi:hypothetical protein
MAQPLTYDNAIEPASTVGHNQLPEHRQDGPAVATRAANQSDRFLSVRTEQSCHGIDVDLAGPVYLLSE